MSDNRKFWWSELSKWDNRVERDWVQWIELVAGLFAMIVLTLSLLAVWTVTRDNSSFSEAGGFCGWLRISARPVFCSAVCSKITEPVT
jgi:predicted small integral membrane protein